MTGFHMSIIKYLFFFILFFILFYLENFNITANITFSQTWKVPFVLFMVLYVFRRRNKNRPRFNRIAYWNGLKNIFNQGILINPLTNIIETFRFTNFPLLYDTFNIYFKDAKRLQNFILRFSQYFILSSFPFILGILKSVKSGMEFGEGSSFIGVFQNAHGASIVLCLALLVLIHHLRTNRLNFISKLYNILLISFGLYCFYTAFVRTGYLMFAIGLIILLFPTRISIKQSILFSILTFSLVATFYLIITTNVSFRQRILDQNTKGRQLDVGSGRLIFAKSSLKFWSEGNLHQIILGRGLDEVKDNLESKTGMKIFSHNGFVDAIAINGILGLSLFLLFIYFTYKNIKRNKKSKSYRLALAVFFCYISFQLTQGGAGFPIDLYLVSILNLINKERAAYVKKLLRINYLENYADEALSVRFHRRNLSPLVLRSI